MLTPTSPSNSAVSPGPSNPPSAIPSVTATNTAQVPEPTSLPTSIGGSGGFGGSGGVGGSGETGGGGSGENGGAGGAAGESAVEAYDFAGVQEFMLTWNCRGCHEGSDGPDPKYPRDGAELYALFMSHVVEECGDAGQTLVVPGDPDNSGLISVLEGKCVPDIPQMPPMEFGPTPEERAAVRGWVANGALQ